MLADIVRTPDTIRESGRNLLAYRVRGGHYPRPDAIRCDNGGGMDSLMEHSEESILGYVRAWAGFST